MDVECEFEFEFELRKETEPPPAEGMSRGDETPVPERVVKVTAVLGRDRRVPTREPREERERKNKCFFPASESERNNT